MRKFRIGEMTWPEFAEWLEKINSIVLIPIGSLEQHGPHLPMDTDAYDAEYVCNEVAKRLLNDVWPLVAPTINYGVSMHHMDFPGTVTLSPKTLIDMLVDICESLIKHGVKRILIVNGHGGNAPSIQVACQILKYRHPEIFIGTDLMGLAKSVREKIFESKEHDIHAGEFETSTSLANRERFVRIEEIEKIHEKPFKSELLEMGKIPSGDQIDYYAINVKQISELGYMGYPWKADKKKGKKMLEAYIENLATFIRKLCKSRTQL